MNSVSNRRTMLFFVLTLLYSIAVYLIDFDNAVLLRVLTVGQQIISLGWIIAMIRESGFNRTLYFRILLGIIPVLLFGMLAKLQHWPIANPVLLLAYAGVLVVYSIRFFKKKRKEILDMLKWAWVISALAVGILLMSHYVSKDHAMIPAIVFLNLIFVFSLEQDKKRSERAFPAQE